MMNLLLRTSSQRLEVRGPLHSLCNFKSRWIAGLSRGLNAVLARCLNLFQIETARLGKNWGTSSGRISGVRKHAGDFVMIRIRDQGRTTELALGFGRLGRKDVAHLGLAALELAGTSLMKALRCAAVGLQ